MRSAGVAVLLAAAALCTAVADAHLCIVTPPQRDGFDISEPGSPACFRHGGPCGGHNASAGCRPGPGAGSYIAQGRG